MVTRNIGLRSGTDGLAVLLYATLVIFGWMNIFASVFENSMAEAYFNDFNASQGLTVTQFVQMIGYSLSDFSLSSTRQLIWIGASLLIIIVIMNLDYRSYEMFAYLFYGGILLSLLIVMVFAREINGARSWIEVAGFRLQPSEFAKFATALALARYMTMPQFKPKQLMPKLIAGLIVVIPAGLIILQHDVGSALVFGTFALVLYRENALPTWILLGGFLALALFIIPLSLQREEDMVYYLYVPILSITLFIILFMRDKSPSKVGAILLIGLAICLYTWSVRSIFDNFLEPHQKNRILILVDPDIDEKGLKERYNLNQSLIAIGSGGFWGKGYLEGTQTELGYVPEQSTDFIFCTVGEEHGWKGSLFIIALFMALLYRLIVMAERQKDKFARIYGYAVASVIFLHFAINIGMAIGLFPVIGIPLPFISYGGSSLWGFTILLFIFIKLDANRDRQMERH